MLEGGVLIEIVIRRVPFHLFSFLRPLNAFDKLNLFILDYPVRLDEFRGSRGSIPERELLFGWDWFLIVHLFVFCLAV